jgi:hypothetical protein
MKIEPRFIFQKKEILKLQAPELYFLLDDLGNKLEYSLSSAKASFLRVMFHIDIRALDLYNLMKTSNQFFLCWCNVLRWI